MILHAVAKAGESELPWLVFLHGFSGCGQEWMAVGEHFSRYPRLYLDLPGHGGSSALYARDFNEVCSQLYATLISYNILNYWLVGYSLGGRIAMYYACMDNACQYPAGLQGAIVEGGHPGLTTAAAREARWLSDARWARRFRHEPLAEVFNDWYRQPVFAGLSAEQRRELVAIRCENSGAALAAMLEATSLAIQPDLRPALRRGDFPFYYLCGEHDHKFRALGAELAAPCQLINDAGHNAHRENPGGTAASLAHILRY
ncbi:2-succinyl-6-hydroxy-2,4-cyclohexadiene-1-carboxylate synthase [Pseudescherichia sp.]|uniref:2-succinyl-6-hydroxy-2, 4-cyclohexadiene-1-carboxylate synthase n=1 Tax=Pseudescherichia sp. TaxID=2055881 RepID=UPI0028A80DDB|nr:2-succinyl-6-hydroxy-2,4-cyclohexadiene-1-carboxylate synthase [Pseudescherichia sp.]